MRRTEFVKPYDSYQTYGGNLFEQVEKVTAFTLENIRSPLWVEPGVVAARHPYEVPKEALREAIVNAIVHRAYNSPSKADSRGEVLLYIHTKKIEIIQEKKR